MISALFLIAGIHLTANSKRLQTIKCTLVSLWALSVGDPINFNNSFFVQNCYLNLNFFQELQSALRKN